LDQQGANQATMERSTKELEKCLKNYAYHLGQSSYPNCWDDQQDLMIELLLDIERLRAIKPLCEQWFPWYIRCLNNKRMDIVRKHKPDLPLPVADMPDIVDQIYAHELINYLYSRVGQFDRKLLDMLVENKTYDQISRKFSMPTNTIKSIVKRKRERWNLIREGYEQ
jgi:DNA-directed RNA polymerase specialized sigma24 family protein